MVPVPSTPPDGTTTPPGGPICEFQNQATTLGFAVTVGGVPDTRHRILLPGTGAVYEQVIDPAPGGGVNIVLGILAFSADRRYDSWTVSVGCRAGCTQASALAAGEEVATAVSPSDSKLVGPPPSGVRFWHPGPLRAVVRIGP